MKRETKKYIIILSLIALLIAVDLITKAILFRGLNAGEDGVSIPVINNFFSIERVWNSGASFGVLKGKRWFFIVITIIMMLVIGFIYYKQKNKPWLLNFSIIFIFAGAIGNFIDRIVFAQVRDMIYFHFFPAVFNIADACVTVGTILLAVYILFIYGKHDEMVEKNEN